MSEGMKSGRMIVIRHMMSIDLLTVLFPDSRLSSLKIPVGWLFFRISKKGSVQIIS